jgi:hypothetical protein
MRVRHEHVVEEAADPTVRVVMIMVRMMGVSLVVVVVVRMVVVSLVVVVVARVVIIVSSTSMRVIVSVVMLMVARAHAFSPVCWWWCLGTPPSECSAWKMASETSCLACSFSKR